MPIETNVHKIYGFERYRDYIWCWIRYPFQMFLIAKYHEIKAQNSLEIYSSKRILERNGYKIISPIDILKEQEVKKND